MNEIISFSAPYFFLSNFSPAAVRLTDLPGNEMVFPTVEHAYQAAKTLAIQERSAILQAETPAEAKQLGRQSTIRADWEQIKLGLMRDLLYQKFAHADLARCLLDTGDALLIEGNTWDDRFWGAIWEGDKWVGANHLGRLLMEVRASLKI
jgi:ribA/ribD-fused uncharacterized protein